MTTVSVIVPIYNGIQYIHRCIDSILSQSFRDFELIIVDDGSSDGSEKICDDYAALDSRVRVIHKLNGGVSNARNVGLVSAKGEYVAFCDGDDYFRDDLLDVALAAIQSRGADIASFQLMRLSLNDIKRDAEIIVHDQIDLETNRKAFLEEVVTWKTGGWQACRSLFRRRIIDENKIRFCETCNNYAEDLGFTLEFLVYAKRIVFVNEQLYFYDDTRENSMMNKSKKICRVDDVNEVSYFLYPKLKAVVSDDLICVLHHHMMMHEIGKLYSCRSLGEFKEWHEQLQKITKLDYFMARNTEYYEYQYAAKKIRKFRSQIEIVDRYLTNLNQEKLLFAWKARNILMFCGRIRSRIRRK